MSAPSADLFGSDSDSDSDAPKKSTTTSKANLDLSSSDSDSDAAPVSTKKRSAVQESDSDSDDDRPAAKKPKNRVENFFEAEAEDEGEEREYTEAERQAEELDENALAMMREQDRRRLGSGAVFDRNASIEDVASSFVARHRAEAALKRSQGKGISGSDFDRSNVGQQALMPGVEDPKVWMFKCKIGQEEALVIQIMNKALASAAKGRPLGITAACAGKSRGIVYVEGFSEPLCNEAVAGIRMLMIYSQKILPISDMTSIMEVTCKRKPVKDGQWVRLTRQPFKGDLARVERVMQDGNRCVVKYVPRIDLELLRMTEDKARQRKKTGPKPRKRFFNRQEIYDAGGKTSTGKLPTFSETYDMFDNQLFDADGYCLREVSLGTQVVPCEEKRSNLPTLEEFQDFRKKRKGEEGLDEEIEEQEGLTLIDELSKLQQAGGGGSEEQGHGISLGDTVIVVEGDLINLKGKVMQLDDNTVKVAPLDASIGIAEVEFLVGQVRKHLEIGAHVKVLNGRYGGETGAIHNIVDREGEMIAFLMTDMTSKEISVRISQLTVSSDVSTGQAKLDGYELFDLVAIAGERNRNEVGIIVKVGREEFDVVNQAGSTIQVNPEQMRGKRNSNSLRATALDFGSNPVRVGDSVNILDGEYKNKSGTIKHIFRAFLFLHSQTMTKNSGVFVVKSTVCSLLAGGRTKGSEAPRPAMGAGRQQRPNPNGGGKMGKTVTITKGQWKGYMGIVTNETDKSVQVELHSRPKKVFVKIDAVKVKGDKFGPTNDDGQRLTNPGSGAAQGFEGGDTPYMGSATPMGGTTPMNLGGITPGGHAGGMTPMGYGGGADEEEENAWIPGPMDRSDADSVSDASGNVLLTGSTSALSSDGTPLDSWTPGSSFAGESPSSTAFTPSSVSGGDFGDTPLSGSTGGAGDGKAWFIDRVYVTGVDGVNYILKNVDTLSQTASAQPVGGGAVVELKASDCASRLLPEKDDNVLVFRGPEVGSEGKLVVIDGNDAIFSKPEGEGDQDFKIVEVSDIARV